jgi:hypothetical protein
MRDFIVAAAAADTNCYGRIFLSEKDEQPRITASSYHKKTAEQHTICCADSHCQTDSSTDCYSSMHHPY